VDRDRDLSMAKEKFGRLIAERLQATHLSASRGEVRRPVEIQIDLDAVRYDLHRSSFGLDFLRKTLDPAFAEAAKNGVFERHFRDPALCLGTSDENRTWAVYVNGIIKKGADGKRTKAGPPDDASEQAPAKDEPNPERQGRRGSAACRGSPGLGRGGLGRVHHLCAGRFGTSSIHSARQRGSRGKRRAGGAAALLTSSQLERPETAYERRLYVALTMQYTISFQKAHIEAAQARSKLSKNVQGPTE